MALSQTGIRRWYLVHKWTSIVCTVFLLMFCITGLPLIFHHEIDDLTRAPAIVEKAEGSVSLDAIAADALKDHAGWVNIFVAYEGVVGKTPPPMHLKVIDHLDTGALR